jgi:hypothetical protein
MEFFNKKEEVIELKLTQFGRFVLSKGKFKPAFYSFFDDNILYNSEKGGVNELQNESEARIQETPTMKHQTSFSSLEKDFNFNYEKLATDDETAESIEFQKTAEKHYSLAQAIGTSDFNAEFAPAWSVQFLNGLLTGSVNYINLKEKSGNNNAIQNVVSIPQLTSETTIDVIDIGGFDQTDEEFEEGFAGSSVSIASDEDDLYILLKVAENNALYQKKNFDIELFEVEEEVEDGVVIESLKQLAFSIAPEVTSEVSFVDDTPPTANVNNTEYYFDLLVDDEIDDDIICKFDPINEKIGVFADERTKVCQDIINQHKKRVFDIYEDEADSPGEIC